jgi:hypothetical protein
LLISSADLGVPLSKVHLMKVVSGMAEDKGKIIKCSCLQYIAS